MPFNPVMRRILRFLCLVLLCVLAASTLTWGKPELSAREAFERLKGLTGTWEVTQRDNSSARGRAVYSQASGGSVLTEQMMSPQGSVGMLTIYHMDGEKLVLTHYCGAGNQPRMRMNAVHDGGRKLVFEMYDITNLASPQAYRSTGVDVVFLSDDRVNLEYRGWAEGRESTQVFQLTRKKGPDQAR